MELTNEEKQVLRFLNYERDLCALRADPGPHKSPEHVDYWAREEARWKTTLYSAGSVGSKHPRACNRAYNAMRQQGKGTTGNKS
jgi:hypothetical protein